jgi:DNA-binding CsgD family transcriptional regulator
MVARPAGLTERETQVVTLLARGLPTKQIGRALGISAKTAGRHVQNAYAKIGVSTRAAARCSPCSTASRHGENSRWAVSPGAPSVWRYRT